MKIKHSLQIITLTTVIVTSIFSCTKLVEIDPPTTDLITKTVFASDATANAAMADIYYQLWQTGFASGTGVCVSFLGSISSDEGINQNSDLLYQEFADNNIKANNALLANLWNGIYNIVYRANSIIQGVESSSDMSANAKKQLSGEAKFIRAFCNFYLVNLWGDVPLVMTSDYTINNSISRSPVTEVYQQIISDLKEAQAALPDNYSISNGERVRANKGVATALLARVYLYREDWAGAETEASSIIQNTSLYNLEPDLALVFRGAGSEPILQLWSFQYPNDRNTFFVYSSGPNFATLTTKFVDDFEAGDQRWAVWGQTRIVQGVTYHGVRKYFDFSNPPLDYSVILRLAEQYLIRAEARAKQNKILGPDGAETDINMIRNRAGLGNTTATTQDSMLLAIEQERRSEFFTEWGHRWFDLKRTGRVNAILAPLKPDWQEYKQLYPIPENQIISDPNVTQNPGY